MIPCCIGIAIVWVLAHDFAANSRNAWLSCQGLRKERVRSCGARRSWAEGLGIVGAFCLIVASSVLESDGSTEWTVHVVGATSFFLLQIIGQLLITIEWAYLRRHGCPGVTKGSAQAKLFITITQFVMLVIDGLLGKQHSCPFRKKEVRVYAELQLCARTQNSVCALQ